MMFSQILIEMAQAASGKGAALENIVPDTDQTVKKGDPLMWGQIEVRRRKRQQLNYNF